MKKDKFPFFQRDEHLNSIGHQIIADALKSAFVSESGKYELFSTGNKNERYPTFYDEGMSVLYQSQEPEIYRIMTSNLIHTRDDMVWESPKELIHPSISKDANWLVFTQGDQDKGDTDVIVFNRESGMDTKVNPLGYRGAIPTFSNDSRFIAYPKWKDNENPVISVYEISSGKEVLTFGDKVTEVWRPIFAPNDSIIYFIEMDSRNIFEIKGFEILTRRTFDVLKTDYNIWDIAVSPSGEKICYAGNKDGNWDLFLYDIPTKNIKQLTKSIGNEWDPVFHSEDEIWFAGEFGTNNGIYHIKINK